MKRATSNRRAIPDLSRPASGQQANRHRLLPAARRALWPLLRARARGPRRALRERLRVFLRVASVGALLRLVRQAGATGAVALALATSASAAEAVELADVAAGRGGFVVQGTGPDFSPLRVSDAGDVDGDGLADVLIGAPLVSPGEKQRAGASFVVFGKDTTEAVELADVAAGEGGFVIRGEFPEDRSGWSVSGAGDLNGDGLADLLIGAPGSSYGVNPEYGSHHASYVVFGKATTEPVDLADVAAGEGGFAVHGSSRDGLGFHVSGAGDVNGDGLADIVVLTRGHRGGYPRPATVPGVSYVIFGKPTGEAVGLWDVAAGEGGFAVHGSSGDGLGFHVSGAGDVNGDRLADIVVLAPGYRVGYLEVPGASYVVFGKATTEPVDLADVAAGEGGFVIRGESESAGAGHSVAAAGDVDGDGLVDLLIGAPFADPEGRVGAGATYVVLGTRATDAVELSDVAAGAGGFVIRGEKADDRSGYSVSAAGDIDGDGLADVLIGAPGADPGDRESAGASHVVFGKDMGEPVELADVADATGGFVIRGELPGDRSGTRISGGSDINGDGVPDAIIGNAREATDGTVHVVFGPLREGVPRFRRGEVNGDLQIDISDGIATLGYLFLGAEPPACLDAADANDDGQIDISDGIATLGYLFLGSARPPVPGPTHCGIDPTDDALDCESPPGDCR